MAADKSHARIIWDCSWAHEGDVFATASRDKTVRGGTPVYTGEIMKQSLSGQNMASAKLTEFGEMESGDDH